MEEKKKRSKCVTSKRETIILNSLNPKEKIILDFLANQFNKSDSIKDILYDYIVSNNLQVDYKAIISKCVVNSNQVISNNTNNDKYMVSDCKVDDNEQPSNNITNDNEIINDCVQVDNKQQSKHTTSDEAFAIDLSAIDEEEVNITTDVEKEDATANAMNFLSQM